LPASFLKHSDDQTVIGLSAVFGAIQNANLDPASFRDWGVLAAPRFLGRHTVGFHVSRFAVEGAWGVSPHLIPHRSLHSLSGSVSQALKIHGPNFGVGGGPSSPAEVLLNAVAMLHCQHLPGVWVVMTDQPETAPQPTTAIGGQALALALVPSPTPKALPRLALAVSPGRGALLTLDRLLDLFEPAAGMTTRTELDQGGWLEVSWPSSGYPAAGPEARPVRAGLSSSSLPVETER
jgi:hypothetical protein